MTIRPDRGLRDLQTVEVLVEPVQQYGFVEFSLCTLGEPSDRRCDYIGEAGRSAAGVGPAVGRRDDAAPAGRRPGLRRRRM